MRQVYRASRARVRRLLAPPRLPGAKQTADTAETFLAGACAGAGAGDVERRLRRVLCGLAGLSPFHSHPTGPRERIFQQRDDRRRADVIARVSSEPDPA